ncbi:phosphotransferase [Neobacillus mesonae]|uniref:phosphotransferase n=1 Tax=Neobacillus mesonae TaxID=1193713 RepID=UPI002574267E|nr:phosphotransferase [Neobacillus mesonae]MED4203204.1 phosphotransferase [Neobacillus mesonae]
MTNRVKPSENMHGDDAYFDRLFSYFQSQFHEKVVDMTPLQRSVLLLKTEKNLYVMKGYQSNRRLKLQEAFTATLRKEGFSNTYAFLETTGKEQLYFEGTYFGCIEYISPNKSAFTYYEQKDRREGLDLLEKFHRTTASFEARYERLLSKADLTGKWKERLMIFSNNIPFLRYFMNEPFISEMVAWADWSLNGMEKNINYFEKEPYVILHGDVAHHNFLRDKKGKLYLIDFDLISIGPAALDYLQYANRILPYIDWSLNKLGSYKQFRSLLRDKAFLYALAYPADILREWNRLVREQSYSNQKKLQQVMDLSIGQFYARKKFFHQIKGVLE